METETWLVLLVVLGIPVLLLLLVWLGLRSQCRESEKELDYIIRTVDEWEEERTQLVPEHDPLAR